jgi:hypothetical protein
VINNETGEIILKKPVTELGKVLTNGHIFLLPVKATEVVSGSRESSSMSTTVQVAFVLLTGKNNLHQDFLNRSVSFILRDSAINVQNRKDDIEKGLTQITGGHVNVYEIHESTERPGSVVHAWILYPARGTVDLRNLQKTAAAILGLEDETEKEPSAAPDSLPAKNGHIHSHHNESIHTASIVYHDYQTLVLVLIFFIILTIIFLLSLCCIWFCCCRSPSHIKKWLDSSNETAAGKAAVSPLIRSQDVTDKTSLINQQSRKDRDAVSSIDSEDMTKNTDGYSNAGFKYHNKVKRIRPARQTRAKLARSVTLNTNDMIYPDDSDRRSSKMKSMESSFDDDYDHVSFSKSDGASIRTKDKRTEIMYIRSPPESFDETYRNSENDVTVLADAEDRNSDGLSLRRSSMKQVSFMMHRMNTPAAALPTSETPQSMKRQRSDSNETLVSAELREESASESTPITEVHVSSRPGIGTPSTSSSSNKSVRHVTTVSVPGTVEETDVMHPLSPNMLLNSNFNQLLDPKLGDEDYRSDSDSGIGRGSKRGQLHGDLNIKNKDLMEKKNIFTLAYDGVRTQRIRSSESDRDSL